MRLEHIGKHVRSVGMCATEILRTGQSFGISLHKESAEIRNQFVDFINLFLPPFFHISIQRVGCRQTSEFLWRRKVYRYVNLHAVRAQNIGNLTHMVYVWLAQHLG